jgi:hypothetical protein
VSARATLRALATLPALGTHLTPGLATLPLPALATATRTLSTLAAALPAPALRGVVTATGWLMLLGT